MTDPPDGPVEVPDDLAIALGDSITGGPVAGGEGWISREVAAMAALWARGTRVTADEILARLPKAAAADPEAAIRLIFEEICQRRDVGLAVDPAVWLARYPQHAEALQALFDCDRLLDLAEQPVTFPETGETLGPFLLLAELGRGAAGRTYLATDPHLADRPVVVKVIPDHQDEHLALARLRHTHIVPLFSEHSQPERGLRMLCMPYLGGASLARILDDLAPTPLARRTGRLLAEVIDRNTRAVPAPPPADGPFRRVLERSAYPEAIAWVVACLADALSYAHERGLVHMDIKPSNVLITVDGQPMLLDFHLARGPIAPGELVADRLGGTVGWMSPEQEAAMQAVREGQPVPVAVDGRSDIYSLGLLLREGLSLPSAPGGGADPGQDLRHGFPGLSVGLTDIIRKCLARDPDQRYRDASALADDLRRHINDLPLHGVRNRSLVEGWRKWRRRHPGVLAWGVTSLAILAAAGAGLTALLIYHAQEVREVRATLESARAMADSGHYDDAIRTLEHGLHSSAIVVNAEGLSTRILTELRRVRRERTARQLRELADHVRYRYGIDLPSAADARVLIEHCRTIWNQHERLLPSPEATLDPDSEARIRTDLIEIVVVWTDILVQSATPDASAAAREEARHLLAEADAAFGPSLALDDRRAGLQTDDTAAIVEPRVPRSIWEYYDRGRFRLRRGQLEDAVADFRQVLATKPDDFWSNFYDGLCAFRRGQFHDAVAAYRTCLAILPDSAACYYNRALALAALGRADDAYRDNTRALAIEPALAPAWLNRGNLAYAQGRYREAIGDLEHALTIPGVERQTQARVHYNLALARLALDDLAAARREAETAVALGSVEARTLLDARPGSRPPSRR